MYIFIYIYIYDCKYKRLHVRVILYTVQRTFHYCRVSCIFNKTIRAVNVARHYTVSENHR